jgi:surface polysaccharide O-acyltransferase-like enzyme
MVTHIHTTTHTTIYLLRVPLLRPRLAVFPFGDTLIVAFPLFILAASFMAFPSLYPGLCLFSL